MKNISIIGKIKNHYPLYLTISDVFRTENVIINCTKDIAKELKVINTNNKVSYNIIPDNQVYRNYIDSDLNFIDQPYSRKDLAQLAMHKSNVGINYLMCHNANTWFFPFTNIHKSFKLKNILSIIIRNIIKKRITNYILMSNTIEDYLKVKNKKNIFSTIPFDLMNNIEPNNITEKYKIRIVIPGTISKARNYELIIKVIYSLAEKKKLFSFIFLGTKSGSYGSHIFKKLTLLQQKGFDIKLYDSFVETVEFDYQLKNCHIILTAFNLTFITTEGYIEYIGVSKETGVPFTALHYGKILILPQNYNIPDIIKDQAITYNSSDELVNFLLNTDALFDKIIEFDRSASIKAKQIEKIKKDIYKELIIERN